jgi:hypothetical protein
LKLCGVDGEDAIDELAQPTGVDRFYTSREPCNAPVIECTLQCIDARAFEFIVVHRSSNTGTIDHDSPWSTL